ncbi:MAG: hemerythrin domain-containing protein [Aquificaceae bacterium]|nr:MAG: hemerythrin domain-containing protein [Aquificaceae bacterium]
MTMKVTMNIQDKFKKITTEHEESLLFAEKILKIAESDDKDELLAGIEIIKKYYADELELHFQHEERTIFAPLYKEYREHIGVAPALLKEHGFLRLLVDRIELSSAKKDLNDFALVLRDHTLVEDKELFPLIEKLFTEKQLEAIATYTPAD